MLSRAGWASARIGAGIGELKLVSGRHMKHPFRKRLFRKLQLRPSNVSSAARSRSAVRAIAPIASVWTTASATSTGCAPNACSTGPAMKTPSGWMSVNAAVIAASAPGRSAFGTRSVRIVWIGGSTIPFAIPEATSAAEYTAAGK